MKNHHKGGDKWIEGEIIKKTEPIPFSVKLTCGKIICYHQNQLRKRYCDNVPQPQSTDDGGFNLPTSLPTVSDVIPVANENAQEVTADPEVPQTTEDIPDETQLACEGTSDHI